MRIDSPTGANSWLQGNFKGRFKGILEGTASYATLTETASYALTASYVSSTDFGKNLDRALDDPENADVFERLRSSGRLIVSGGILITSGNVELDDGYVRIGRSFIEYLPSEDSIRFRFGSSSGSIDPSGSVDPSGSIDPEPTPGDCEHCPYYEMCHPSSSSDDSGSIPVTPVVSCGRLSPSIDFVPGIGRSNP